MNIIRRVIITVTIITSIVYPTFASDSCNASYTPTTAADFAAALHPGWNPGNTMDAPHETDWGNPLLVNSTFTNVKDIGFNGIRLPVTWTYHMQDKAPYAIDEPWLQRVSDVVDMITSNGLYVLLNAHHDSWASFDLGASGANYTQYEEKFYALWYQIGGKFACKSHMIGFEPLNEPAGSTAEHAAELNKLQRIFFKAIHDAGGHNSQRVVVLGGLGDNAVNMVQWLELPSSNISNPYALTFHYYSPWDFVALAWGRTIWGSETDKMALEADFAAVRNNFTSIPIIVGEYGMEIKPSEPAARWKWFDHVMRLGRKYEFTMMLWDASIHFVKDSPEPWQDPTGLDVLLHAAEGELNTLADSTEDGSSTEQWSSATLWHRVGTDVVNQSLPFLWNGNKLVSVQSRTTAGSNLLRPESDYTLEGSNITFKVGYLSTIFSKDRLPGLKANITLQFSSGADLQLQAIQWDTPQPAITDFIVNASNIQSDLKVPFEFKGLAKMATVKARMINSTYLFDDWTQWLGPLQQARLTYQSHWDFDSTGVIVKSSVLQAVHNANIATGLTFEFYPRVHANTVNFSLGVIPP